MTICRLVLGHAVNMNRHVESLKLLVVVHVLWALVRVSGQICWMLPLPLVHLPLDCRVGLRRRHLGEVDP